MKKPTKIPTMKGMWGKLCDLALEVNNLEAVSRNRINDFERRVDEVRGIETKVLALAARVEDMEDSRVAQARLHEFSAAHEQSAPRYCVIGDSAKNGFGGNIGRTWKDTQHQAENHAASIHRNHPGCPELFVVKVVSKVGRKEPDIKVTRI